MKNTTQPDPTRNPIDPNPFLTLLKWPVWPVTHLTRNPVDLTRLFAMSSHEVGDESSNFSVLL